MSLNVSQYIERVRRLACQNQVKLDQADIESSLTVALQLLGEDLPKRPDFNRLQIDTAITFANGTADLSSQPAVLVILLVPFSTHHLGHYHFLVPPQTVPILAGLAMRLITATSLRLTRFMLDIGTDKPLCLTVQVLSRLMSFRPWMAATTFSFMLH